MKIFNLLLYVMVATFLLSSCSGARVTDKKVSGPKVVLSFLNGESSLDWGIIRANTTADLEVPISINGGVSATDINVSFTGRYAFKGGSYPGTGGTCKTNQDTSLCTLVITFSPVGDPNENGSIAISYGNGTLEGANLSATLYGSTEAVLSLSPSVYNFSTIVFGAVAETTFTLTHESGTTATNINHLSLGSHFRFKGGTFPGTGGSCTDQLSSGSCTLILQYNPIALGTHSHTLTLRYDTYFEEIDLSTTLQGRATAPARIQFVEASPHSFGQKALASVTDKTYTVTYAEGDNPATSMLVTGTNSVFQFKGGSYPGTGGTCGSTLASGNCTLVFQFAPTALGSVSATPTLSYFNGASTQSINRTLQGEGVPQVVLAFTPTTAHNFGIIRTTTSVETSFTVQHTANTILPATSLSVSGLSAPITFKGGSYPGTGGTCSTTLVSGASCTLVVTYAPTAAGTFSRTLAFNYNNGAAMTNTPKVISGTTEALLTVSDAAGFSFGSKAVASTTNNTFTVTHAGGTTASTISSSFLSAVEPFDYLGGTYPGTGGTCGSSLTSGSCTIIVRYSPTTLASHSNTLSLSYFDHFNSQTTTRAVSGTGTLPAVLEISDPGTHNFGTRAAGSATDKIYTVTHSSGGVPATSLAVSGLNTVYRFKGGSFPGTGGTCVAATLAVGASCTLVMQYAPTTTGLTNMTFTFSYNNGASSQSSTRTMEGTAVPPALLMLSSTTNNFGTVNTSSTGEWTMTISHSSGGVDASSLDITGVAAPFRLKGGSYPGTGGTCGSTIAISGSCTVVFEYAPTAIGIHSRILTVSYNNGASTQNIFLTLSGKTQTQLSTSPTSPITVVSEVIGNSGITTLTLSHGGGATASSISASFSANTEFQFLGGSFPGTGGTCTSTLNSGSCTLRIRFLPTTAGTRGDTLSLNYFDGVNNQTTALSISGIGKNPSVLSLAGSTFDFGGVVNGATSDHTFVLSFLSGDVSATSIAVTGLSAPFNFKGGSFPGTGGTCPTSLSSASCTIVLTYSPSSSGAITINPTLSYNDGHETQNISLSLSGTGIPRAVLTLSSATHNFGTIQTNSSGEWTLGLAHSSGGVSATSIGITGTTALFRYKGGTYPGTGGNCGTVLTTSGTCSVVLEYAPTIIGTHSQNLSVNYFDGASTQTLSLSLSGKTQTQLSATPASPITFTSQVVGNSGVATITLTHGGGSSATSLGASFAASTDFSFVGGSYPGSAGTCGSTLASGTCTLKIKFLPTTAGIRSDSLDISYQDGLNVQTLSLQVSGVGLAAAGLTLTDSTFDFGVIPINTSSYKTFTLSFASGDVAATSISVSGLSASLQFKGGSYPGTGGSCGTTLTTGSCTLVLSFAPTSSGTHVRNATLAYNDGNSTQSIAWNLSGQSETPATLTLSGFPNLEFGTHVVGTSAEATLTLTHSGERSATLIAPQLLSVPFAFKGETYPGAGGDCGDTLALGQSCSLVVVFSPNSPGPFQQTLSIDYFDGFSLRSTQRGLQGTGTLSFAWLSGLEPELFDVQNIETGSLSTLVNYQSRSHEEDLVAKSSSITISENLGQQSVEFFDRPNRQLKWRAAWPNQKRPDRWTGQTFKNNLLVLAFANPEDARTPIEILTSTGQKISKHMRLPRNFQPWLISIPMNESEKGVAVGQVLSWENYKVEVEGLWIDLKSQKIVRQWRETLDLKSSSRSVSK